MKDSCSVLRTSRVFMFSRKRNISRITEREFLTYSIALIAQLLTRERRETRSPNFFIYVLPPFSLSLSLSDAGVVNIGAFLSVRIGSRSRRKLRLSARSGEMARIINPRRADTRRFRFRARRREALIYGHTRQMHKRLTVAFSRDRNLPYVPRRI